MLRASGRAAFPNGLNFEPVKRRLNFEPMVGGEAGRSVSCAAELNFQPSADDAGRGLKVQLSSCCYHDSCFYMPDVHGHNFVPMYGGAASRYNGHIFALIKMRRDIVTEAIKEVDGVDRGFTGLNFQPSAAAEEREHKIAPSSYCYHDFCFCKLNVHELNFQPMYGGEEGGARLC